MQLIDRIKTLFTPTESGDVVTATGNRGQTSLFPNNTENTLATTTTTKARTTTERGRSRSSTKGKTYVNKNLLEYHLHNAVKRAKGSRCCRRRCRSRCCCCLSGTQTQTQSWAESRPCPGEDPGRHKKATKQHQKTTTATTTHACLFPSKKHWKGWRGEGVGVTHSHTQQGCISLAHKKLAHIFRVTLFLYGLPACLSARCLPHIKGQSTLWNKCLIGSGSAPLTLDLAGTQTPHSRGEFPLRMFCHKRCANFVLPVTPQKKEIYPDKYG